MDIDMMEAFAALEHYDIRVARSKYVDSAEDAVAFAERRNAPDPRFVPIVLRGGKEPSHTPLDTVEAVREAYDAMRRHSAGRILAQVFSGPGTDIVIFGKADASLGKTIGVHSATHTVQQAVPLGEDGAKVLASDYEGYGHHGSRESARRMLEHLLVRISDLFTETEVREFRLDVRLHENEYTVFDASMTSLKALHIKPRLDKRAHDRKGDEYRPAGRQ
ncbi:MAG: hypothetical protein ACYDGM_11060 [Vulcanimicrobiaceae bacterium]